MELHEAAGDYNHLFSKSPRSWGIVIALGYQGCFIKAHQTPRRRHGPTILFPSNSHADHVRQRINSGRTSTCDTFATTKALFK